MTKIYEQVNLLFSKIPMEGWPSGLRRESRKLVSSLRGSQVQILYPPPSSRRSPVELDGGGLRLDSGE